MARFNSTLTRPKVEVADTVNFAGGDAYSQSAELEISSILLTSLLKPSFYRGADDTIKRIKELLPKVTPQFAAKLAIFARDEFGMRSVTHVVAAELGAVPTAKFPEKRAFFSQVIIRVDDMLEILAYWKANFSSEKLPNAMLRGFRDAFNKFDTYQIAKYKSEGHGLKLVDAVNLIHPRPTPRNAEGLTGLIKGTLKNTDTWEAKLSASQGDEEAKGQAWKELLSEKRLGYMALLKNLRNISQQGDAETIKLAAEALIDADQIKKSRVFPYRFYTAYKELVAAKASRVILDALSEATDISVDNIPYLKGDTAVLIDCSGSMSGGYGGIQSAFDSAAPLAAALARKGADLYLFDTTATRVPVVSRTPVLTLVNELHSKFRGGGTDMVCGIQALDRNYDRLMVFSDMQVWVKSWSGTNLPGNALDTYARKYRNGVRPEVYTFDVTGYGTMQFPERSVVAMAGFSDKIFDVINLLESGNKNVLVDKINSVQL